MNILVVGGGGREHAIAYSLSKSPLTKKLIVAPGNPGIETFAECYPIAADNIGGQCKLAKDMKADIVFIGPEIPLVLGLKDKLSKIGINAFGPSKKAAQLEGSKTFSRNFCKRYNIPQPNFKYCSDLKTAKDQIELLNGYCVVKADGLAAGKGVVVCDTVNEAIEASTQMLKDNKFGDAGKSILIEERITGIEASVFAVSDGNTAVVLGTAQDHKRAYDNDQGPNTGGMGAISPAPALNEELNKNIFNNIIMPTIKGMRSDGIPYEGILYAGVMLTDQGPKVIEFNCRFGDPETQVVLPRLSTDLVDIIHNTVTNNLENTPIELTDNTAITVVIASKGYPGTFKKGIELPSLNNLNKQDDILVFHSGTAKNDNENLISSGGRVLSVTAIGDNVQDCRQKAYKAVEEINWDKGFYRRDIGKV
ncbi:phosphoribosylamine--glycine ligase [Alphaproteobacteria bacterium]|nr:phosphoribosylamine--glycine ligase [Alphaproteobacteria bacterium]